MVDRNSAAGGSSADNLQSFLTKKIPIEGHPEASREFRKILGFEKYSDYCRSITSKNDLNLDAVSEQVNVKLCKFLEDNNKNASLVAFINLMVDMNKKNLHVTCAEIGYYKTGDDMSYTYLGFFMPVDYIDTMTSCAEQDEEIFIYRCDAQNEKKMREKEIADPVGTSTKEFRNIRIVSRDIQQNYLNMMMLRYPLTDIVSLGDDAFFHITGNYIWVQVKPRIFGDKMSHVVAFMRGFMQTCSL